MCLQSLLVLLDIYTVHSNFDLVTIYESKVESSEMFTVQYLVA